MYLFTNSNGPRAERDTLAEALVSSGDGPAIAEPDIVTMNLMER